ncbi:MAG: SpoIIE family protein phosphatase [Spirochaetales bacterium]|nr:SpoIIE family protein phosphatase [Spirochaetales bacterium]
MKSAPGVYRSKKRKLIIGVLGDKLYYDIPVIVFNTLKNAVKKYDMEMLYFISNALGIPIENGKGANILYQIPNSEILDGVIVISNILSSSTSHENFHKQLLKYHALPVVSLGLQFENIPSIVLNNITAIQSLVNHLVKDHHYRKIAYLRGRATHVDDIERYNAFLKTMEDNRVPVDQDLILQGNFSTETARLVIKELLDIKKKKPGKDIEAIVCSNDYTAVGVVLELQSRGIKIPEDIAVTGFDDIPFSSCLSPTFTTISQPFGKMAEMALELMIDLINGKKVPSLTYQSAQVVYRRSCGCANPHFNTDEVIASEIPAEVDSLLSSHPFDFLEYLNKYITNSDVPFVKIWSQLLGLLTEPQKWNWKDSNSQTSLNFGQTAWASSARTAFRSLLKITHDRIRLNIGAFLSSTLDLSRQLAYLKEQLPLIGISRWCLCLYESPEKNVDFNNVPELSRVIQVVHNNKQIKLAPEAMLFKTLHLLPEKIYNEIGWSSWTILALYFHDESIGYMMVDPQAPDENIYHYLQVQLSGALKGSLLLKENQERTQQLAKANDTIKKFNAQLQSENLRFKTEMELARNIQTALLPKEPSHVHPDFELASSMLPADEVGGDYYDIALDSMGDLWLGIGDVSGHGLKPGLIMMLAQTIHTTLTTKDSITPAEAINLINHVLYKSVMGRMNEKHYMTCVLFKYKGQGVFQYAGMHLDILIYRKSTGQWECIATKGMWLNVIENIEDYTINDEFHMNLGDVLILYTDGITEAMNAGKEMLGTEGLLSIVARHVENPVNKMHDAIIRDITNWQQGSFEDDISLLIARRIR